MHPDNVTGFCFHDFLFYIAFAIPSALQAFFL
jgi:hypothetical protein